MDQQTLKTLVHYDPETGIFTNLKNGKKIGEKPNPKQRYKFIALRKKSYMAHRLAFIYMGVELNEHVDHINRNGKDNRWENLRTVTRKENLRNSKKSKWNTSGCTGVYRPTESNPYWTATILGKHLYRGLSLFEAVCRRRSAELRLSYLQHS